MHLIGVTPTLDEQTGRITINQDYLDALRRAGALPVLLPLAEDTAAWEEMLRRVDGLLLSGGADLCPASYGEEPLPVCGETAPLRDAEELYLCRRALEMKKPLLAICRGHQVLNCALGGTLYQDIAAQYSDSISHPRHDTPRDPVHPVSVTPGSRLAAITGRSALQVNSRHHQAVKDLGRGLTVSARAEDGLIEAIEYPAAPFALGVQWHPEALSDRYAEAQALFNAFVEACGA